jgi:hypothetical protein
MRKAGVLVVAILLACPIFAANESREQKRLEACGQVFKEIMDIPDGIPKDLLNKAECVYSGGRYRHRDEDGSTDLFPLTWTVCRDLARGFDASV